jgi:hypothetical protein
MYYLLLGCTSPIRSYFQCSTKLLKPKSIHVYDLQTVQGRQRSKGLSLAAMWGSAIDPRTMNFVRQIYGVIDHQAVIQGAKTEAKRLNSDILIPVVMSAPAPISKHSFDLVSLGITESQNTLDPASRDLDSMVDLEYKNLLMEPALDLPSDGVNSDALAWWKDRRKTYPLLHRLAMRILIIPATSAPSERLFSNAGITIANDRARLLPEMAEKLVLLHDHYKMKYDE